MNADPWILFVLIGITIAASLMVTPTKPTPKPQVDDGPPIPPPDDPPDATPPRPAGAGDVVIRGSGRETPTGF